MRMIMMRKITNIMITLWMPVVQIYYLPFSSADVCPLKESTLNSLILKLTTNCKNQIFVEYDGIYYEYLSIWLMNIVGIGWDLSVCGDDPPFENICLIIFGEYYMSNIMNICEYIWWISQGWGGGLSVCKDDPSFENICLVIFGEYYVKYFEYLWICMMNIAGMGWRAECL